MVVCEPALPKNMPLACTFHASMNPHALIVCMQSYKVELGEGGQVYVNGHVLSDSAVEQRLRRLCKVRKNGTCEVGEDARKMFQMGGDDRATLMALFKESRLSKAQDMLL